MTGLSEDPHTRGPVCPVSGKARMTKSEAKSTAKRAGRHQGRGYVNLEAYKCRSCGSWHVGNRRRFT